MDSLNWRQRTAGDDGSAPPPRRDMRSRPQRDEPGAAEAIAEGKRVYLGNLSYDAKPPDVEEFLAANQFGAPEKIHISVDPISGRNPGYCFVEFADRATAEQAIATLDGQDFWGREAKCRPCLPKADGGRSQQQQRQPREGGGYRQQREGGGGGGGFSRWGDWGRERGAGGDQDAAGPDGGRPRGGPNDSLRYFESGAGEGKQLYVGGLPRMVDQATNEEEMREIFQGFEVVVVGKRISPRDTTVPGSERRNFCFVDFASPEQASAALDAVNGAMFQEAPLKVSIARGGFNSRR